MEYKREEIKAGLMVVISFVILIGFIVLISGLNVLQTTKIYSVRFQHNYGIVVGSVVRYAGMEVGKVADILIPENDNTKIEFQITVDEKIPIKIDSEAFISSIGILGDYYVEITAGSLNKPLLPSGSQIKSRDATQIMQLTEPIEDVSFKLQELIDRMNKLVDEQSQYHIASIIAHLDTLLIKNSENISKTIGNLNQTTSNFKEMSHRLNTMLDSEKVDLGTMIKGVNKTIEQMQTLIVSMNKITNSLDQLAVSHQNELGLIIENMEQITSNIKTFSQSIKERPYNMVRITGPKERKLPR